METKTIPEVRGIRLDQAELRATGNGKISGYASVFYDGTPTTEFRIYDGGVERIMPSAFDRALNSGDDVRCLFNHNQDNVLGRVSAGTLRLEKTDRGLFFEADLGDTTIGRDTTRHIERRDVQGCSFSFGLPKGGDVMSKVDGVWIREIHEVAPLLDVGPVTFPAYEATEANVRRFRDRMSDSSLLEKESLSNKASRQRQMLARMAEVTQIVDSDRYRL